MSQAGGGTESLGRERGERRERGTEGERAMCGRGGGGGAGGLRGSGEAAAGGGCPAPRPPAPGAVLRDRGEKPFAGPWLLLSARSRPQLEGGSPRSGCSAPREG